MSSSKRSRHRFTTEQKVAILKRHMVDKVPVSDLCDELGLQPSVVRFLFAPLRRRRSESIFATRFHVVIARDRLTCALVQTSGVGSDGGNRDGDCPRVRPFQGIT
jgi:transposase-like protein